MTDEKNENIDPSKETVIGFDRSELHHDLKNQPGEKGNPDHATDDDSPNDEEE